jgi:hypothetical protein
LGCLRDDQTVFILGQEVELQRMADAAWPVDGCNVRHVDFWCLLQPSLGNGREMWVGVKQAHCSDLCRHYRRAARAPIRERYTCSLRLSVAGDMRAWRTTRIFAASNDPLWDVVDSQVPRHIHTCTSTGSVRELASAPRHSQLFGRANLSHTPTAARQPRRHT